MDKLIKTADELEGEFRNKPVLIGDWVDQAQAGECRHRALLFKILADEAGLDVALVRGNYAGGSPPGHAWNEASLGDGRRVIVDVMHDGARPRCLEVTAPEVIERYLKECRHPVNRQSEQLPRTSALEAARQSETELVRTIVASA